MNPKNSSIAPPEDLPEYAWGAWYSCLHWAIGEPKILARFKADTGLSYSAPRCAIDAMIDDATGFGDSFVLAFVPWFNEKVWGPWEEPTEEAGRET
jgi:hypothetical protein